VCDEAGVRALLASLLEARGVECASGRGAEASYGFADEERATVKLRGPKALEAADEDVLVAIEVGRSFPEGPHGRAFARERASERILEIDRDPRRALSGGSDAIPPLVDARFLAGSLGPDARGFREIRIEPRDGEALRIARDPSAPADADSPWLLERGGATTAFPGWRVGGYLGLWLRGSFESFANPRRPSEIGLEPPAAKVVLVPDGGEPIELAVSDVAGARAHVLNRRTNVAGAVPAELQPLLAPRAELFTDAARPNPWEAWLRKP
jgi:hypothetical protein